MNVWYKFLLNIYQNGLLTEDGLNNAVLKEWITEEEKMQIISYSYVD